MRKMKRKMCALFLAVALIVTTCFVPWPSLHLVEAAGYSGYNAEAAMAYAAAHWADDDGSQCAEFVSNCVRAGGISIGIETFAVDVYDAVISYTGIQGQELSLDSRGYATEALDGSILQRGDVVLQWCYTHEKGPHVLICSGYDSEGVALFYAHNDPLNNARFRLNHNTAYQHTEACDMRAKVVHISGDGPIPLPSYTDSPMYCIFTNASNGKSIYETSDGDVACESYSYEQKQRFIWSCEKNSDGTYRISSWNDAKSLDVRGGSSGNGTNIHTYSSNDTSAQKWRILDAGNGKVVFEPMCAQGSALDMGGDSTGTGSNIHLWQYSSDNENQKFIIKRLDKDSYGPTIKNVKISDVTSAGYQIDCDVSDDIGIDYIEIPTWTDNNGKDDLKKSTFTLSDGHLSCYVSVADHNSESGKYTSEITVGDLAGNVSIVVKEVNVPVSGDILIDSSFKKPDVVMSQGTKLTFGGSIKSDLDIDSITIGVYQVTDSETVKIKEKTVNPASKSYVLSADNFDTSVLAAGGYTFRIIASTAKKQTVLVDQVLLVTSTGMTIDEGEYRISAAGNPDVVISVTGGSIISGANVIVSTDENEEYQKYSIEYLADGFYSIVNNNSGMALAVKNTSSEAGTTVVQVTKNTSDEGQKWQILPTAGGTYCLVPACATDLVAGVQGGTIQSGDNVMIFTAALGSNQRFFIEPTVRCETHTWNSGKLIAAATCTDDGAMKYTCTVCKYSETRVLKAKGHILTEGVVIREPSRFEDGIVEATCTRCGEVVKYNPDPPKWVEDIVLDQTTLNPVLGSVVNLHATTLPNDAVDTDIIWTSSDDSVATVTSDGTVTAVGVGEATITASAADSFPPTTQYRSRKIVSYETKTTTVKGSLGEEWEYIEGADKIEYGDWGSWSNWSTTPYQKSDTRDVGSEVVPATYKTQYKYTRTYGQGSNGFWYCYPWETGVCLTWESTNWLDSPLPDEWDGEFTGYGRGYNADGVYVTGRDGSRWDLWWYNPETRSVQATAEYTRYRYRDRTKTIIYTYKRPVWSDWTAWSSTPVEAASDVQIETRDMTGTGEGEATVKATCKVNVVLVGWITIDGDTYYYTKTGEKVTGIQKISGVYYLFNENGVLQRGWCKLSDKTYYTNENGAIQAGLKKIEGKTYYFNAGGVLQTGWLSKSGAKYYFDPSMVTGVYMINGKKYLFNSNGTMFTGIKKSGGKTYFFGTDGAMRTGWISKDGKRYYFDPTTGAMQTGSVKIEGKTYAFGTNGVMKTGWISKSGKKYYFDPKSGAMATGVQTIDGKKYYFNSSGVMQTGWMTSKNKKYYFDTDGTMVTGVKIVDGVKYVFASTGELIIAVEVEEAQ